MAAGSALATSSLPSNAGTGLKTVIDALDKSHSRLSEAQQHLSAYRDAEGFYDHKRIMESMAATLKNAEAEVWNAINGLHSMLFGQ
jgi:hypothetical protein